VGLWIIFVLIFFIVALFPRVPMYNPVFLTKEGVVPCKIYGESDYPTRALERKFELTGKERYSFTVSTVEPAPYLNRRLILYWSLRIMEKPVTKSRFPILTGWWKGYSYHLGHCSGFPSRICDTSDIKAIVFIVFI
jgi:hypothetical protein